MGRREPSLEHDEPFFFFFFKSPNVPSVDATSLGRNSTSELFVHVRKGQCHNKNMLLEKDSHFTYLSMQLELEEKLWQIFI